MYMSNEEFTDRFEEIYPQFKKHQQQLSQNAVELALASYIRFIEKKSKQQIQIVFTKDLPRRHVSVTVVNEDDSVTIYAHAHYQDAEFGSDTYHVACVLIAHELAHLILKHSELQAAYEEYLRDEARKLNIEIQPDYEAFAEYAGVEFEADLYGAMLAISRAPVFERTYFYKHHTFIKGAGHRHALHTDPFQTAELGFLRVLELLEKKKVIHPPHEVLAEILAKHCKGICEHGKKSPLDRSRAIVTEYRNVIQKLTDQASKMP